MTVWRDKKLIRNPWRFDFWLYRERHTSSRGFESEQEANDAEYELRRALRREAAGLEPRTKPLSPRFRDTAAAYYAFAAQRALVTDLDTLERMHHVILQFFGPRPGNTKKVRAPYHHLRLQDPIDHPSWILKFEDWMSKRGIKGPTKNRYRSTVSRLYWFAMLPERREESNITSNPFRGLLRDKERGRDVTLSIAEMRSILQYAPDYLRLAIVIAALAPKLRMRNILQLQWAKHFDHDLTMIRVGQHKTEAKTGRPMVAPISAQLQRILLAVRARQPKKTKHVIVYRGEPIHRLEKSLENACRAASVAYGRKRNGATFHTIRHSAATLLAQLGVPEGLRKDVMGHLSIQTTQGYTHLNPIHERGPLELLSAEVPLEDLVTAPRLIGRGKRRLTIR